MSYETTMARSVARKAEADWRDHLQGCPPCSRWNSRHRGWTGRAAGQGLRRLYKETAAELAQSRTLDSKPIGMDPLW